MSIRFLRIVLRATNTPGLRCELVSQGKRSAALGKILDCTPERSAGRLSEAIAIVLRYAPNGACCVKPIV